MGVGVGGGVGADTGQRTGCRGTSDVADTFTRDGAPLGHP